METTPLYQLHSRNFEANRFVYPVVSRRSRGLSLGINLNPDKVCNFDCVYCQVDRTRQSEIRFVEQRTLYEELEEMLKLAVTGEIFAAGALADTPAALRRLNDIAFSGDGEPTTYRNFDEIVAGCTDLKRRFAPQAKSVLITNASMFHRPHVCRGLEILDANHGEIWAKLEAGTEAYFHKVDRTPIRFAQILENITVAARVRPLVIQSLFMRLAGESPAKEELISFCDRLNEITSAGGRLSHVQVYTVARRPAESYVTALPNAEVDAIVELVQTRTGIPATAYYGATA